MGILFNASILRIKKNSVEKDLNSDELIVEYNSGIYVLQNNFRLFDLAKTNSEYVGVSLNDNVDEVVKHLLYRLKKEKLNPLESAYLYTEIEQLKNVGQATIAKKLGVTQGNISNKKRLMKLPLEIQSGIIQNEITERHGRALLQLSNREQIIDLYNEIKFKNLNVSATENVIDKILNKEKKDKEELVKVENKRDLKNKKAILIINQLENDIKKSFELLNKTHPEVKLDINQGIKGSDYVFNITINNVK